MTKVQRGILSVLALLCVVATANASTPPNVVTVDCTQGQSLNRALSKLDKHTPTTVLVNGTCTEAVQVLGFENLTLKGLPGATLVQPSTSTSSPLFIGSSSSVLVIGLSVDATTTTGIGIGHGSTDILLRGLNVTGGPAITVFENSQVSIANVKAQSPGYAILAIYDSSDVHLERSQLKAMPGWVQGIQIGASHITMYDVTITNSQIGIAAFAGAIVDMWYYSTYYKAGNSTDITISNPAGTNTNGVQLDAGSSLNLGNQGRLVIDNTGHPWNLKSGAVLISNGSIMNAPNGNLVITRSQGQGIVAMNNSHATVTGTIQGSGHGGLVATNLSSIDVAATSTLSTIGGNSVDLFCDVNSWITGTANIAGAPTAQCANLLPTETAALP